MVKSRISSSFFTHLPPYRDQNTEKLSISKHSQKFVISASILVGSNNITFAEVSESQNQFLQITLFLQVSLF